MGTSANVDLGPGLLYVAPIGTTEPASATAARDAAFREVGYTDDGSTFTYEITNEPVEVEEELDPIEYATTGRAGSVAFAMAEVTRQNLALALNSGANAATSGSIEPPAPGAEVRVMLLFDSDSGARWLFRKCLQAGTLEVGNKKAPQKRLLPVTFRLEKPTGQQPFIAHPNAAGLV